MSEHKTDGDHRHEVRIHIDQKLHHSPSPTTGEALYALGKVPADLVLYREVGGDREDEVIKKGPETVHLKDDEHFHSGRAIEQTHEVRIHIDQKPYLSPNRTTGQALYALGNVPAGLVLYCEVRGDREDDVIKNGPETVHLKEDEHFHSGPAKVKEFRIIVNGREKIVAKSELSFAELVALAFQPVPVGPNVLFTITYRHGPHENPEGTLIEGATVKIKNGMIFNVTETNKS